MIGLFLTSKVRLHCDVYLDQYFVKLPPLFLTSKVRLHCDDIAEPRGLDFESGFS